MVLQQHKTFDWERLSAALGKEPTQRFITAQISAQGQLIESVVDCSVVMTDVIVVLYCYQGHVMSMINGMSNTFEQGQMCILFPGVSCKFQKLSSDFEAMALFMHVSYDGKYTPITENFPRLRHNPIIQLEELEQKVLLSLASYVENSVENSMGVDRWDLDSTILSLMRMELSNIFSRRNLLVKESSAGELLVKRFNMLLAVSVFEHRDVEFFAQEFGMSPKRFGALVKRVSGHSPSEMIASMVIKHAKHLLSTTTLTSSEISEKLNFATPSFFCRYFKRYVGVAPQEWREQKLA